MWSHSWSLSPRHESESCLNFGINLNCLDYPKHCTHLCLETWDRKERTVETSRSETISQIRPPSLSGDEGTTGKTRIHTLCICCHFSFTIILSWYCRLQLYPAGSRHLLTLFYSVLSRASHPRAVVATPGHHSSFPAADMMSCDKDTSSCMGGEALRQPGPPGNSGRVLCDCSGCGSHPLS